MMKSLLAATAALALMAGGAFAQPAPGTHQTSPSASPNAVAPMDTAKSAHSDAKAGPADSAMNAATPSTRAAGTTMRRQLSDNLKKAGYTDVKVRPDAFIVEAKNKSGDPVMMFLSPDSMTVFTAVDPKGADTKTAVTAAK